MEAYFMTHRPPMPGAQPVGMVSFEEYPTLKYIPSIGHTAYAKIFYDHPLTVDEIRQYELTPALVKCEMTPAEINLIIQLLIGLSADAKDETLNTAYNLYGKLKGAIING